MTRARIQASSFPCPGQPSPFLAPDPHFSQLHHEIPREIPFCSFLASPPHSPTRKTVLFASSRSFRPVDSCKPALPFPPDSLAFACSRRSAKSAWERCPTDATPSHFRALLIHIALPNHTPTRTPTPTHDPPRPWRASTSLSTPSLADSISPAASIPSALSP